jgi:DNA-binding NarL/FixJ family response regulator
MPPLLASPIHFSQDDSTQWVVLCVGVLATLYLVMRGRLKGRRGGDPMERPAAFGVAQQRQVERDLQNLMVEVLDTARQMTAQLDMRAARLELLVKEADVRLAALKAAASDGATGPAAPVVERPIIARAFPAVTPLTIEAPAPAPVVEEAEPARPETPPDPRHSEVYAMADQGRTPQDIARQLNRPNGEVELILALRPHHGAGA